jgi:outer membrane protease
MIGEGIDADVAWEFGTSPWSLFAYGAGKFGIPGKTGVMKDRDWQFVYSGTNILALTNYSNHYNSTQKAVFADARVGATLNIGENFLLKFYAAYSFMTFSWSATGGSLLYRSFFKYYSPDEEVITYKQTWHTIAPGVSFGGAFNRYFSAEIALSVAPFVWCNAVDDHLDPMKSIRSIDVMDGGFAIEPSLFFSYTPISALAISLNVAYKYIAGPRGDTFYHYIGSTFVDSNSNQAGAGYNALDVGIRARYKLRVN